MENQPAMKERKQRGRRYSRRDLALEAIRVATLEGDETLARRIYVQERIGRKEFNEHVHLGRLQRAEKQGK
jgi:hypothetical protein